MNNKFTFELGQRVVRKEDVFDPNSKLMHGTIINRYSKPAKTIQRDLILGPYPELYTVEWDSGHIDDAYLPHGLTKENQDEIKTNP